MGTAAVQLDPQKLLGMGEVEQDPLDLLKDRPELQTAVKSACKHFLGLDKWVRRSEIIETRRQRFYWRSDQYILWKNDATGFIPVTGGTSVDGTQMPRYTDVYNIYTPYGESLLSTLVQNAPGINWQPADPSKPKDGTASKTAEKYQQKIERDNDRKKIQSDVARLFYTDTRTILLCERNQEGIEEISAHGTLETKVVPITSSCRKDLVAVFVSDEIDIYHAKGNYKSYAQGIIEGASSLGESSYERIARLGVLQGTALLMQAGDAFAHMVTRHKCFLRPCTFDKIDEKYRDEIAAMFPEGLKATFCGEQYCGSENISMDDQISIGFPGPGDGMSRPSMGKRVVPLQDVFNDEMNLWHEAHDYCVPTLFMYSETGDINAIREQISEPGNVVPFTSLPPGASSAESAFYAAVLEGIPETLPQLVQLIQGPLAEFISGAFPALFGGDTGDNDTAKGISIQRDQAMGRMALPWGSLQKLFASAYTQAVISVVKNASDDDNFSYSITDKTGKQVTEEIAIADLKGGNTTCIADEDSSFPESTNAKRQTYQTLMAAAERNPILAATMAEPDNQEYGHEVIGLPDLVVPGAESRNKQLIEIEELLAGSPIPPSFQEIEVAGKTNPAIVQQMMQWIQTNQQNSISGQPPEPLPILPGLTQPSVAVDPQFDNNPVELETCKVWLSSEARRKQEAKGNFAGIDNVRLHALAHMTAIPPPPTEPPPGNGKNVGTQTAAPILAGAPQAQPSQGV